MKIDNLTKILLEKRGYLKSGPNKVSAVFGVSIEDAKAAINKAKELLEMPTAPTVSVIEQSEEELFKQFLAWKEGLGKEPVKESKPIKKNLPKPYKGNPNNVLVIGDLHEPFCLDGYLEHCRKIQEDLDCGTVIFIGDIIDSHYSSFHGTDPDGFGAGEELERAIAKIANWYQVFPEAKVCLGNHDLIIMRKAFAAGVSKKWIKGLDEVLETPDWEYDIEFEINGVLYTHGTGTSGDKAAYNKALNKRMSVVQGHLHTTANIQYNVSNKDIIFAMQIGCGIDDRAYAFSYAAGNTKKSIISCGVVLNGTLPILTPMKL